MRGRIADGDVPVVVCSALSGVSDALERLAESCVRGAHTAELNGLRIRHAEHARALGLQEDPSAPWLADLERLTLGASLIGEASPRLKARILSFGELALTALGAAWLRREGIDVAWLDARQCLTATDRPLATELRRYLGASVHHERDEALRTTLSQAGAAVITQGFIARNNAGETVLLGRGGSDTSAAVFAARLGAKRCEIWTDVPGMFSANPRQVPAARLIRALAFDEAQEIASSGAKVLHPACIAPVRDAGIPLEIRCTPAPHLPRTRIGMVTRDPSPGVKAISARTGITLVSLETVGMWQQVGFLADTFACFKRRGISVDLVSTSETSVTVSLDPKSNGVDRATLDGLIADLSHLGEARVIGPCASITLVGQRIRAILHRLGPALELFEEHRIHLVTQAASDLNLTVVVDEAQEERLVHELHALLFDGRDEGPTFGPTWSTLFKDAPSTHSRPAPHEPWWYRRRDELTAVAAAGTPVYVYDAGVVEDRARAVLAIPNVQRALFALKANDHPELLRRLEALGMGFECVSPGELEHLFSTLPQLDPTRVLFTPNFARREDYEEGFKRGVHVNLDALHPLRAWPDIFAGEKVFVRLDPGRGRGHHEFVKTAGARSKFGISPEGIEELKTRTTEGNVTVVGLHAHAGSGIRTPEHWTEVAAFLCRIAAQFPQVKHLDLGGGLGVPEKPEQSPLDLASVGIGLEAVRASCPQYELWLEPGRFLVAESGVLLARVTQLKQKGDVRYVGVDAGMHTLIRPALYGAWHEIVNLSRLNEPLVHLANVVGPICESGDVLGRKRLLPDTAEGDLIAVGTAGAYGRVMASTYNRRALPREVVIERDA